MRADRVRPGPRVARHATGWLVAAATCVASAAAPASGAPAPIRTETLPAGAELRSLDDAGRVTITTREEGRRRVMRRAVDGRWTTLLELAGPDRSVDARDVVATGNTNGRLLVAWGSPADGTDPRCAPRCIDAVVVARSDGDAPLREIARLPVGEGPASVSGLRVGEMSAAGDAELGYRGLPGGLPETDATVTGDVVTTRPAEDDQVITSRIGDDGTRYAVTFGFRGSRPTSGLTRQAPGGSPAPLQPGMSPGIGPFDIEPLSGGRVLVLGAGDDPATDATLRTAVLDASGQVVARSVHPGATAPARRASPTPGGGRVLSVRRGTAEELLLVSPAGEVSVAPWPGGPPLEGVAGADRSGAVLLAESRARPGGAPDERVFRLRRLSPYGGEDPVVEVPAGASRHGPFDFDALRTSGQGAVAAVPPGPAGGAPTLLWRGPDVQPPVVRARAAAVRGTPRRVLVRVRCDEGCQVRGGRLPAAAATRRGLVPAARATASSAARLPAGRSTAVRLRVPAAQRRAVARAHRRGRSHRVVLRTVVRDPLGNARTVRVGVRVRPGRRASGSG